MLFCLIQINFNNSTKDLLNTVSGGCCDCVRSTFEILSLLIGFNREIPLHGDPKGIVNITRGLQKISIQQRRSRLRFAFLLELC